MYMNASYSHEVAKNFLSSDQPETFQDKYWILFEKDQRQSEIFFTFCWKHEQQTTPHENTPYCNWIHKILRVIRIYNA